MTIWHKIIGRGKEPSSYAGLAAIIAGIGLLGDIHEAPQIAATVEQAGAAITGGNFALGVGALVAGLAGIFLPERGANK